MRQMFLPLPLQAQRFEIGGAWWSTIAARGYIGATCIDLSWPWLTFAQGG